MCFPICPKRSGTAGSPRFTKQLGDFDYIEHGKPVVIQCCSDGVSEIKWYRQENGHWNSYPPAPVPGMTNQPSLEENDQILRINDATFQDNTTFKCEVIASSLTDLKEWPDLILQHQLRLYVVACDKIAKGPIMTQPFPKDQYIDDFGENVTLSCSGYFGCSDDGNQDGDADWLVKENGRYKLASQASPRYNVTNSSSEDKTKLEAKLTISHVIEEDLEREFICKLSSPQVYEGHRNLSVRIYKHKDPVNIEVWIGLAVGVVIVVVVIFVLVKYLVGRLWGPQIKWYLRSRVTFMGPKPAVDEDLNYNAFMYHADDDVMKANDIKSKLEKQNFVIFLSSEVKGGQAAMAAYQETVQASAVVIFLYTENLRKDRMADFFLQCVVEYRNGKGILFLEVEKYSAEEVFDCTEKAKKDREKQAENNIQASLEEDGEIDEVGGKVSEKADDRINIKFWRALPRLKVPTEKSSEREKKNFHCSIQNRLPLLKNQVLEQKRRSSSSKRSSDKSRHSSSGKPLISPGAEMSPMSDDVFVEGHGQEQKFVYDHEVVSTSRNTSIANPQENNVVVYSQNEAGVAQQPMAVNVDSQNEAAVPRSVLVSVDVHPQRNDGNISLNQNELELQAEIKIINEMENPERLKIDSLSSEGTPSPSEQGVFTLSGEETNKGPRNTDLSNMADSPDDKSERLESGFTEGSLSPRQPGSPEVNSNGVSPSSSSLSNGLKTEMSDNNISPDKTYLNGPIVELNRQLNESPGDRIDSFGSGRESGYVTSPTTGSLGLSPEGSGGNPFIKTNAAAVNMKKTSITA